MCTIDECGEPFDGHHTAQHPAAEKTNNKSLDPLRAKNTFIRKKFGHTAVSAIQASSVTPLKI